MLLFVDRTLPEPLYVQIKKQLRLMIESGTLPPGYCLPPERKLADSLGVNRTTILNAYRDLKAEGFLTSHVGQGTMVNPPVPPTHDPCEKPLPFNWRQAFKQSIHGHDTTTRDLLAVTSRKKTISFAAGIGIPTMNPLEEMQQILHTLSYEYGSKILQHVPTEGLLQLRQSICRLSSGKGIQVTESETIILSGSQQGLDFLARLLISPGDFVVMEDPSFFCARQIFESYGARIVSIPMTPEGMRMDLLEDTLKRLKPKFIYTIPTFHNPTGIVMPLKKRKELLRLAYRYHLPILEDDAYGELRYEGEPLPSLKALDSHGYVLYLSTFSKVLFMGLRVGWLHAPERVIQRLAIIKQLSDLHTNSLGQYILDAFIRKGYYTPYVKKVLSENKKRRDKMHEALLSFLPESIPAEWTLPDGGLYFWLKFPPTLSVTRLYEACIQDDVAFVPGSIFFHEETCSPSIRLNFTYPDFSDIATGIQRLMKNAARVSAFSGSDPTTVHDLTPIL